MLIQLGAARGRGGVEPVLSGGNFRERYKATGVRPSSPIRVQADSARLEGLAGLAPKENRAQAFCASVDPLYLFSCGVSWHRERNASAGWELIQFLRSQDKGSRAIAAALLARTEHARLLIRDLRRARVRVTKPAALSVENPVGQTPSKVDGMNTPYGLEIVRAV